MPIIRGMKKCDLLDEVWRRYQDRFGTGSITHTQVDAVYDLICEVMLEELREGGGVPLSGIGRLQAVDVAVRRCANPRSGELMTIPAGKRIRYHPSKAFVSVFR